MKDLGKRSTSRASAIPSGKYLRLREGLHKQLHDREWIFSRKEKELVFLIHTTGAYGVVVRAEDIEWDKKRKCHLNEKEGQDNGGR